MCCVFPFCVRPSVLASGSTCCVLSVLRARACVCVLCICFELFESEWSVLEKGNKRASPGITILEWTRPFVHHRPPPVSSHFRHHPTHTDRQTDRQTQAIFRPSASSVHWVRSENGDNSCRYTPRPHHRHHHHQRR
uniref:Putative secreted protein n=1 Tax=Anopheles marajoara TaxID=58244 RepID=A0A2M4C6S4_9DIPT